MLNRSRISRGEFKAGDKVIHTQEHGSDLGYNKEYEVASTTAHSLQLKGIPGYFNKEQFKSAEQAPVQNIPASDGKKPSKKRTVPKSWEDKPAKAAPEPEPDIPLEPIKVGDWVSTHVSREPLVRGQAYQVESINKGHYPAPYEDKEYTSLTLKGFEEQFDLEDFSKTSDPAGENPYKENLKEKFPDSYKVPEAVATFKVGDMVVCISADHLGRLELNKEYKIRKVESLHLYLEGVKGGFFPQRFKAPEAEEAPEEDIVTQEPEPEEQIVNVGARTLSKIVAFVQTNSGPYKETQRANPRVYAQESDASINSSWFWSYFLIGNNASEQEKSHIESIRRAVSQELGIEIFKKNQMVNVPGKGIFSYEFYQKSAELVLKQQTAEYGEQGASAVAMSIRFWFRQFKDQLETRPDIIAHVKSYLIDKGYDLSEITGGRQGRVKKAQLDFPVKSDQRNPLQSKFKKGDSVRLRGTQHGLSGVFPGIVYTVDLVTKPMSGRGLHYISLEGVPQSYILSEGAPQGNFIEDQFELSEPYDYFSGVKSNSKKVASRTSSLRVGDFAVATLSVGPIKREDIYQIEQIKHDDSAVKVKGIDYFFGSDHFRRTAAPVGDPFFTLTDRTEKALFTEVFHKSIPTEQDNLSRTVQARYGFKLSESSLVSMAFWAAVSSNAHTDDLNSDGLENVRRAFSLANSGLVQSKETILFSSKFNRPVTSEFIVKYIEGQLNEKNVGKDSSHSFSFEHYFNGEALQELSRKPRMVQEIFGYLRGRGFKI